MNKTITDEMYDALIHYAANLWTSDKVAEVFGVSEEKVEEVLAETASLSVPYISHLERAVKKGSLETLARIAAALGVTMNELLGIPRSEEEVFLPDMTFVLEDCSPEEREFLLEVAAAIKKIMRQKKK